MARDQQYGHQQKCKKYVRALDSLARATSLPRAPDQVASMQGVGQTIQGPTDLLNIHQIAVVLQ